MGRDRGEVRGTLPAGGAGATATLTAAASPTQQARQLLDQLQREGALYLVGPPSPFYKVSKRLIDLVTGGALLLAAMPLMLLAALAIKLTSRGPILFRQRRVGLRGRVFTMHKFRSMHQHAEEFRPEVEELNEKGGPIFKMRRDPRVTTLGRLLRRSSIDELPQLFNVLGGQMSLVGPRPMWIDEARKAGQVAQLRAAVKPGLTCLWQISGRSELSYEEWVHLDLYYVRHRGLFLDLMILIQTLPAVLSARGAY